MFYKLFKLLTVTGLLLFAFTAKAGDNAKKTQVPRRIGTLQLIFCYFYKPFAPPVQLGLQGMGILRTMIC